MYINIVQAPQQKAPLPAPVLSMADLQNNNDESLSIDFVYYLVIHSTDTIAIFVTAQFPVAIRTRFQM